MKRILSVVLVVVLTLALAAGAVVFAPMQVRVQAAQSGDFTFSIETKTSSATILGYTGSVNKGPVYIPENLGGFPVVIIAPYAFANHTELRSVIIPEKVGLMGPASFSGCSNLNSVYFLGAAPVLINNPNVFLNCAPSITIFYIQGKTAFPNPWYGFDPVLELLITPKTSTVTDKMNTISGTSESDWPVAVTVGMVKYKASVVSKKWKVTLPKKLAAGTKFTVCTELGDATSLTAMRFVLPATPTVNKIKPNSYYVKGTATKGATVYVKITLKNYSAKASAKTGAFSVKTTKIFKGNVVYVYSKINGVFSELKEIIVK